MPDPWIALMSVASFLAMATPPPAAAPASSAVYSGFIKLTYESNCTFSRVNTRNTRTSELLQAADARCRAGDLSSAASNAEQALADLNTSGEAPSRADTLLSLSALELRRSRADAADARLNEAIDLFGELYSPWDSHLGWAFLQRAAVRLEQGRLADAEHEALEAERIFARASEEPAVIAANRFLAALLFSQHRLDEAEPRFRATLAYAFEQEGPFGSNTLSDEAHLGALLQLKGRDREAKPLLERAVRDSKRSEAPAGINFALASLHLGTLHFEHGENREAIAHLTKAFEIRSALAGFELPALESAIILARALDAAGESEHGLVTMGQAVKLAERGKIEKGREIALVLRWQGFFYLQRGERDLAEATLRRALALLEELDQPADLASAKHFLGAALLERSRQIGDEGEARASREEALRYLRSALAMRQKLDGKDSVRVGDSQYLIGNLLYDQRSLDESDSMLRAYVRIRLKAEPKPDVSLWRAQQLLGNIASARERYPEAERWYRSALRSDDALAGSADRLLTLYNLAATLVKQQKLEAAEKVLRSEDQHVPREAPAPTERVRIAALLARILLTQHRRDEALPYLERCDVICGPAREAKLLAVCEDARALFRPSPSRLAPQTD